jgi:hypothetical protein
MDGLGLADAVRNRWPQIGFSIVSGQMEPAGSDLAHGVRFFTKPFSAAALVYEMHSLIGPGTRERGAIPSQATYSLM